MKISSDFSGGNCKLISVENSDGKIVVNLEQELRDTTTHWFYWYFKIEEAPEGEITFVFNNGNVVCPHSAATSSDGINWTWCENFIDYKCFTYNFYKNESRYFAFCIPYVLSDFERFFDTIKNDASVRRSVLTESEQKRPLPLITFGNGKRDIIFTARHHCCEATGSYALDGVIKGILKNHRSMLDKFTFHVIPFSDIDGVENGDQGKNRAPHDHNRDYTDNPIYNCTKAIYKYTEKLDIACFIDFHSPWCWGGFNDETHLHFGPSVEPDPDLQESFAEVLNKITADDDIKYKNIASHSGDKPNLLESKNSKNFFKFKRNANIALTIETPYSGNLEKGYTTAQLHLWGERIAEALFKIL